MSRLIDAEALKKDIADNSITLEGTWAIEVECAKALIDIAPTIEQSPVIGEVVSFVGRDSRPKGKWIEESEETGALGIKYTWVKCSECGWSNSLVIPKNYCPNCGANMVADLCSICKHGDNCERSDKGISFANHSSCWKFER